MKKIIILLVVCVVCMFNVTPYVVHANTSNTTELEKELTDTVLNQISDLDLDSLDVYLSDLNTQFNFSDSNSFSEVITKISSGEYFNSFDNIFQALLDMFFSGISSIVPLMFLIVAIAILGSILNSLKSSNISGGVQDIIHFVCFGVVVLILVSSITQVISVSLSAINTMTAQMEIIFPIMLTLLTAIGSISSVSVYQPIVAVLTQGVSFIFTNVLFPIFILSFIFLIIGNLSTNIKLKKFNNFLSSSFKWIIGFVVTLFSAFLTIQGISAGKFDGVSIRATKFAVKSYIPFIGGFISDGFELIMYSSIIIKNAIGVMGLVLIFGAVLQPIITILLLKLGLQLTSAILENVGDSRICEFTSGCAKILIYPIIIIIAVAFMYLLSVGLIMTTANVV